MQWTIEIERAGTGFRWKLFNRHGELIMISRETYAGYGAAAQAVEYEKLRLAEDLGRAA